MATSVIMMELLRPGAHAHPSQGANLLELASVLSGEPWSTRPESVHPALRAVADPVNDMLTEDRRQLLAPLAPWLLGTNTADPRVWPAVVNVCGRAALDSISGEDLPGLLADLDITEEWLAGASSPSGGGRRGPWDGRRHRQWAQRAIWSALVSVKASANGRDADADAALCQVLADCINMCRQLAGKEAVAPRLPLAECPRRLAVQPRLMRSPGCDWIELGYEPVLDLLPACLRASPPRRAARNHSRASRVA
jgi:hypothetical protein